MAARCPARGALPGAERKAHRVGRGREKGARRAAAASHADLDWDLADAMVDHGPFGELTELADERDRSALAGILADAPQSDLVVGDLGE